MEPNFKEQTIFSFRLSLWWHFAGKKKQWYTCLINSTAKKNTINQPLDFQYSIIFSLRSLPNKISNRWKNCNCLEILFWQGWIGNFFTLNEMMRKFLVISKLIPAALKSLLNKTAIYLRIFIDEKIVNRS